MSGEMFGNRDNTFPFQTACISEAFVRYRYRILSEGAQADYRVVGVAVHIYVGGEVDLDPQFFTLAGYFFSIFGDQFIVFDRSQHHVLGKTGRTA